MWKKSQQVLCLNVRWRQLYHTNILENPNYDCILHKKGFDSKGINRGVASVGVLLVDLLLLTALAV